MVLQHQEAGGFLGIDDLGNQPQGDVLDGFNVSLYKIPDSPPSSLDYTTLDTSSIPGYALAIDSVSSSSHTPDFTTYMLSVTGPIVEYVTLLHLFRSDSGQSGRNFRNPVESGQLFFTYILHYMEQFRPE